MGSTAASSDEQVGTVESVNPRGELEQGAAITLTLFGDRVEIGSPESAPTISGDPIAGGKVTLNWTNFTCPSGTGTLSGYNVTITNATFADGSTARAFDPGTRNAEITLGAGRTAGDGDLHGHLLGRRRSARVWSLAADVRRRSRPEATETPEDEGELPEG